MNTCNCIIKSPQMPQADTSAAEAASERAGGNRSLLSSPVTLQQWADRPHAFCRDDTEHCLLGKYTLYLMWLSFTVLCQIRKSTLCCKENCVSILKVQLGLIFKYEALDVRWPVDYFQGYLLTYCSWHANLSLYWLVLMFPDIFALRIIHHLFDRELLKGKIKCIHTIISRVITVCRLCLSSVEQ